MQRSGFPFIVTLLMLSASSLILQAPLTASSRTAASKCLWVGRIEATKNYFGHIETIVGTLRFELESSYPSGERFKLVGGNLTWSASGTFGSARVSGGPFNFNVSSDSGDTGEIDILTNGNYSGSCTFGKLNDGTHRTRISSPEITYTQPPILLEMIVGLVDSTFLQNELMSGSYTLKILPNYFASYVWNLHKENAGETKLEVSSDAYDGWLPEAGKSEEDIGTPISFHARLLDEDGAIACAKADSFKFELKNVSSEPGVALNYPAASKAGKDFDLHFIKEFNSAKDIMSADRLSLQTEGGREATAFIPSFDWGAYGMLKVTAFMPEGKTIIGYLKGHREITEIPLPKRSPDSKIADKWKKEHGAEGLADDHDSESEPVGDGDAGDGFTLYEEYRGFYENGKHVFGDPKTKDLFVRSTTNDFFPGFQLFKALTGLIVHYELKEDEFDVKKRVMNFNHLNAPHRVDQHGLWVRRLDARVASFTPDLGPPKKVDSVNISPGAYGFSTIMRGSRKEITSQLNSTVAHELGHAVRIDHHGETDIDRAWDIRTVDNDVTTFENGTMIVPLWENGSLFTQRIAGNVYVARWGGEHSGLDDCIMRYDCANFYVPGPGINALETIRYFVSGTERTGILLCDKKEDNAGGVNHVSRRPRPRYGDAVKGNCKHQICVNDVYH